MTLLKSTLENIFKMASLDLTPTLATYNFYDARRLLVEKGREFFNKYMIPAHTTDEEKEKLDEGFVRVSDACANILNIISKHIGKYTGAANTRNFLANKKEYFESLKSDNKENNTAHSYDYVYKLGFNDIDKMENFRKGKISWTQVQKYINIKTFRYMQNQKKGKSSLKYLTNESELPTDEYFLSLIKDYGPNLHILLTGKNTNKTSEMYKFLYDMVNEYYEKQINNYANNELTAEKVIALNTNKLKEIIEEIADEINADIEENNDTIYQLKEGVSKQIEELKKKIPKSWVRYRMLSSIYFAFGDIERVINELKITRDHILQMDEKYNTKGVNQVFELKDILILEHSIRKSLLLTSLLVEKQKSLKETQKNVKKIIEEEEINNYVFKSPTLEATQAITYNKEKQKDIAELFMIMLSHDKPNIHPLIIASYIQHMKKMDLIYTLLESSKGSERRIEKINEKLLSLDKEFKVFSAIESAAIIIVAKIIEKLSESCKETVELLFKVFTNEDESNCIRLFYIMALELKETLSAMKKSNMQDDSIRNLVFYFALEDNENYARELIKEKIMELKEKHINKIDEITSHHDKQSLLSKTHIVKGVDKFLNRMIEDDKVETTWKAAKLYKELEKDCNTDLQHDYNAKMLLELTEGRIQKVLSDSILLRKVIQLAFRSLKNALLKTEEERNENETITSLAPKIFINFLSQMNEGEMFYATVLEVPNIKFTFLPEKFKHRQALTLIRSIQEDPNIKQEVLNAISENSPNNNILISNAENQSLKHINKRLDKMENMIQYMLEDNDVTALAEHVNIKKITVQKIIKEMRGEECQKIINSLTLFEQQVQNLKNYFHRCDWELGYAFEAICNKMTGKVVIGEISVIPKDAGEKTKIHTSDTLLGR